MKEWVAIFYRDGDKVDSRVFHGENEDEVRAVACEWVTSRWGEKADWSLHRVNKRPEEK
tara:strand:- start:14895 stop:15071 length:177 start_codon:yes stop_codon:yes gene_type:complete